MISAVERLYRREEKVVQLFDPPFDQGEREPGYISGYLPGVRENGGQYTHGAVWLAMACLKLGQAGLGYELLSALLPAYHDPQTYRAEPYVLAADVYYSPGHKGRGGWSWYTGAAGWYYRAVTQELLGLRLKEGKLFLAPNLPEEWPGYTAQWRTERLTLNICVERTGKPGQTLDGMPVEEGIPIWEQEGEHILRFTF